MENTLENKSKFFGQYWGQKVVTNEDPGRVTTPFVDYYSIHKYALSKTDHLLLKPLSSITDEDAISICNFLGFKSFDKKPNEAKAFVFILFIVPSNDIVKYEALVNQMLFDLSDISSAVDLIRSMGYAYKWMGLSVEKLIEYGWVKLNV